MGLLGTCNGTSGLMQWDVGSHCTECALWCKAWVTRLQLHGRMVEEHPKLCTLF